MAGLSSMLGKFKGAVKDPVGAFNKAKHFLGKQWTAPDRAARYAQRQLSRVGTVSPGMKQRIGQSFTDADTANKMYQAVQNSVNRWKGNENFRKWIGVNGEKYQKSLYEQLGKSRELAGKARRVADFNAKEIVRTMDVGRNLNASKLLRQADKFTDNRDLAVVGSGLLGAGGLYGLLGRKKDEY